MLQSSKFELRKKKREDLTSGQVLYGENEPPEMQLENIWEVVDSATGLRLEEPKLDFEEFSASDRMYPSMMKPDVKVRWDKKNLEWDQRKERYQLIKRNAHVRFMFDNPDLPLAQDLKKTEYGKELIAEFELVQNHNVQQSHTSEYQQEGPQAGTGESIYDELAKDGIEVDPDGKVRTITFNVPGVDNPCAILATACDDKWRIVERLLAFEPDNLHL